MRLTLLCALALVLAPLAVAQTPGTCLLGSAVADLDVNNVRARLFNNGGLFWKGAGNVYNVPKVLPGKPITPNAIFASGIWFGGQVGGQNRLVAAAYSNWELWPGPLDDNGELPGDKNCSKYDRIYLISKEDVQDFTATGVASPDLLAWPVGLGAPTFVDLNGNNLFDPDQGETEVVATSLTQVINLAEGERPNFLGDQMAYWVMNDVGGAHRTTGTAPMGMEVQVTAFAFNLGGALGNTTFYKYRLIYKGKQPLTNAYFAVWSDPDLGNATDDYVGSDTTLGLAYVYNADNFDEGSDGYGAAPPALGYDFFQGPLVDAPGETWTDPDGTEYPNQRRLGTTVFLYYDNITAPNGNPRSNTNDWYNYMQGIWQDEKPMVDCGDGYNPVGLACAAQASPTKFMWPGDPVTKQFWSETNFDGAGNANPPNDRRFLASTGPFVIQPGDVQEIVYGIVTSKGDDNLDSVTRMKLDDAVVQSAYDNNFQLAAPPATPRVNVTELDNSVILSWFYQPQDNNYLEAYEQFNPFSFDNGGDRTYNFEGYRIYQYPTAEFAQGDATLVASFDVDNGVTRVIEIGPDGLTNVVADGTDNGIKNSVEIRNLTNYQQYYFGVQAYAYNGNTDLLKILSSPVRRVTAMPAPTGALGAGVDRANVNVTVSSETGANNVGQGVVTARIIDPLRVTGDEYEVIFYSHQPAGAAAPFITYDIVNKRSGVKLVDGRVYAASSGLPLPQRNDVLVLDGVSFSVAGPQPGFARFTTVSNAAGPLNPPVMGAFAFNSNGFPTLDGEEPHCEDQANPLLCNDRPTTNQQVGGARFGINVGGGDGTFAVYNTRSVFGRGGNSQGENLGSFDYEWRFTGSSQAWKAFDDGSTMTVPFELWNIGVGTPNDPSDDFRMIPLVCETACGAGTLPGVFDIGGDHPVSGGPNDPLTDWVYWYTPADESPGQAGYNAWVAAGANGNAELGHESLARQVIVGFNLGTAPPYAPQSLPEQGTVFRIVTLKPNQPGDVFTLNTGPFAPVVSDSIAIGNIEQIGIVPNPYKGASAYEVSNIQDVARFINMPEQATIRIFTLSGTLIRTLEKSGPARFLDWDLQNEDALPIASGMYLIHVEVPGRGEKVIKFGVIKKRIQLDLL